jgi:HAD ATPase, P-type, family IC
VVDALRKNGHVVGYMGDGVNDAPSLHDADVGISVDNATDVAKASADIILLEKSLTVILNGIYEGRRIYGNILKYMKMALSGNFGNVFSVLIASIFLPFLPILPLQILIQNLIYDFTQIAIPWDNVDDEFLKGPHKWNSTSLVSFMNVMGGVSSVFDAMTFLVLWFILGYSTLGMQNYFQTGWFIEGLISQILIVQFIRTAKRPIIESRCDARLGLASALGILAAIAIPYVFDRTSNTVFTEMPAEFFVFLILILILYSVTIEIVKKLYTRKYGAWL